MANTLRTDIPLQARAPNVGNALAAFTQQQQIGQRNALIAQQQEERSEDRAFRREQASRAQANADRSFSLSKERLDIAKSNAELTGERTGLLNRLTEAEIDLKKAEKLALKGGGITDPTKRAGVEAGLRKEFTGISKDFRTVRDAFGRVEASAKDPSAAGDLALIFNYMKILDPGSVVRESEFATAQNAAGVPERVRNMWNRIKRGEKLGPAQRTDFTDRAKKLFTKQNQQFAKTSQQFRSIATRIGVNPENAVPDFTQAAPQPSAGRLDFTGAPQSQPTQPGLQFLRQNSNNPDVVRQFDEKFGQGAAQRSLGGQ